MFKKLTLLAMAVGALVAFAAPAAANAQLLTSEGVAVPVGTDITATSTNLQTTTEQGILECAKVTIHAKVTANTAETSAAESTAVTTEGCVTNVGFTTFPTNIPTASADLHLEGGGVGTALATFVAEIETPEATLTCHFEGEPALGYESGTDVLGVRGGMAGSGAGCAEAGEIHGEFTLETEGGEPVTID